eukprot:1911062-Prymnesium_polylepis.1
MREVNQSPCARERRRHALSRGVHGGERRGRVAVAGEAGSRRWRERRVRGAGGGVADRVTCARDA